MSWVVFDKSEAKIVFESGYGLAGKLLCAAYAGTSENRENLVVVEHEDLEPQVSVGWAEDYLKLAHARLVHGERSLFDVERSRLKDHGIDWDDGSEEFQKEVFDDWMKRLGLAVTA